MITSKTDAVTCITDTRRAVQEREEAIHFLHNHALTADDIDLLGSVLGDDQPGVRWAAGSALAACGERAVPTLLRAVLAHPAFRDGAVHTGLVPEVLAAAVSG